MANQRPRTPVATLLLALTTAAATAAAACADVDVPAAPGSPSGPITPGPNAGNGGSGGTEPLPPLLLPTDPNTSPEDLGYLAKCELLEEPNGPMGGPNPFYIRRTYEVVPTSPGQPIRITKCGQFGQVVSTPYQLDADDCRTTEATAVANEYRVQCYELTDNRDVPNVVNGAVEELGWTSIHVKTEEPPDPIVCDEDATKPGGPDTDIESIYQEFLSVPWDLGDQLAITSCDCYTTDGDDRLENPGCTHRLVRRSAEDSSDAYALVCLSITSFLDGRHQESVCDAIYYRKIPFIATPTDD